MHNFNALIWSIVNEAGWWWWGPCVLIAFKNLVLLSNLNAPKTGIGRVARVFAWLAHLPMLFSPFMNAMGLLALPLLLIASNVLYMQLWLACRAERRTLQKHPVYGVRRVLNTMIQ